MPVSFDEYLAKELEDPAFQAEWDLLEPGSQLARLAIEGRETP